MPNIDLPQLHPQRHALLQALENMLESSDSGQYLTALSIIDVRDFHELNRSFGRACGDAILMEINERLKQLSDEKFAVHYLGNDEFGVLLPQLKSPGLAVICVEQILALFKGVFEWKNHSLKITANIGIAYNYGNHIDANKLLLDTELALKHAKTNNQAYAMLGKNEQQSSDQLKWELLNNLHVAMQEDELELYYQPKLCINPSEKNKASPYNAEALIRWPTVDHGLISPDITIPLIEHLGSELDLINWLVNTTLKHLNEMDEHYKGGVSVNIPANSVTSKTLYTLVEQALTHWHVEPSRLTLEITEDVLINDKELAFDYLSKVRETGVRISIDDFGTGYSSLAYFKHIPADELKIDQFFVHNMLSNEGDRNIVKLIIDLAHAFNLEVVAEGVENNETLDLLKSMGCDYAQGYLISRPIPYSDYLLWLKEDNQF
ncbi:MAG: bifunctional diguanylate cyclase/phosphodiesterase [Cellvibrionales bacterium]|nr:bifunctional diguanylate cyclase/phosphodiesterase [Cellvibrionales bacterium]